MKRIFVYLLGLATVLSACAPAVEEPSATEPQVQKLPASAVLVLDFENQLTDGVHPEESILPQGEAAYCEGISGHGLDGSSLRLEHAPQRLSGQMTFSCWVKADAPWRAM